MSNLLEQAIIDAAALRETARKSAESALIEKYKDEFQESLEKIMEQEEQALPDPSAQPPVPGIDQNTAPPTPQSVEDDAFENIPSSFFDLEGDPDELVTIDFDKLTKQSTNTNSSPILASPEMDQAAEPMQALEEDIELDEELYLEYEQSKDMTNDALYEEEDEQSEEEEIKIKDINQNNVEDEFEIARAKAIHAAMKKRGDIEEEYELSEEFEELEEQEGSDQDVSPEMQSLQKAQAGAEAKIAAGQAEKGKIAQQMATAVGKQMAAKAATQKVPLEEVAEDAIEEIHSDAESLEEDFELTEEEIQELAEQLKVDLEEENQLRGWMGTTSREKKLARDVELAKARDDKAASKRKKEEEVAKDLECKLEESKKENKKLLILVEELKDNLISLKEHVEKLSISNAKLLYINKVFGDSSLNERQKENIVESISRSSTVLEAKTIYGTLQSAVQTVSERKQKESLSEALVHGNSAFISRPKANTIDDGLSQRMRILAGIK